MSAALIDSVLEGEDVLGITAGGGGGEAITTAGADGAGAGIETAAFFLHPETERMGKNIRRMHHDFRFSIPNIFTM